jgi:hypothetical protein
MSCDFCGEEYGVQHVAVQYTPNDKVTAEFALYLCTDCLIEWMGEDL